MRQNTARRLNILTVGYGENPVPDESSGILPLAVSRFFSGPISSTAAAVDSRTPGGFVDILKARSVPPVDLLWRALFLKKSCGLLSPSREGRKRPGMGGDEPPGGVR